ncbi:MAG: PAS domain S-box protein, partial [Proteobacteria bacterium]|nr:PAS domain S-box protein [Pseudomonadota bacterium]
MGEGFRKSELEFTQQTIKFFETVLRASGDGIVITDMTQNIVVVNDAFCDFFGRRWRDVVETNLFIWLEQLDADAPLRWAELEQRVYRQGGCRDIEFQMSYPKPVEGTEHGVRHLSVNAFPVERVADEEEGVIISIWRDVSTRKRAEEEIKRYAAELERSNGELEQFAYVASHDLQEPLRKIEVFGDRIKSRYGEALDERGQDYVNRMQNAARRMRILINDLLTFSRIT